MQLYTSCQSKENALLLPLDAPPVYSVVGDTNEIEGGEGQDLVKQVADILKQKRDYNEDDMHYI